MKRRILCALFSILFVLSLVPFSTFAAVSLPRVEYDTSDVTEDLEKLLEEDEFDALILDETMKSDDGGQYVSLIRVVEYGYDAKQQNWNYFGLYAYVYNPSGKPLQNTSNNSVGLQVPMRDGTKTSVMKCPLKFLDCSDDHVLYKYEIRLTNSVHWLSAMDASRREYFITGLEMQFEGMRSPKEFDVSSKFWFEGFDAGFDSKRDQTNHSLRGDFDRFETIDIELHPTSWLSDTSDKGEGWKYEISGVYFAIPNYYLKKFGNWDGDDDLRGLHAVEGSYNEYKLNGIVTDSDELYQAASDKLPFQGNYTQDWTEYLPLSFFDYCKGSDSTGIASLVYWNQYSFNLQDRVNNGFLSVAFMGTEKLHALSSVFKSDLNVVSSDVVLDYFNQHKNACIGISAKLGADEGRTLGYNPYKITAGEKPMQFTRYDYSQKHPFLGWFSGSRYDEIANVEWLQRVDPSFFESFGSNLDAIEETAIANKYYVGVKEADSLLKYATSEKIKTDLTNGVVGSTVYLMHFAKTDYFADQVICYDGSNVVSNNQYSGNHYYFERTIFDDFDILSFTFRDAQGKMSEIPLICSPVDITGDLPPANAPDQKPGLPGKGDKGDLGWDSLKDWAKLLVIFGGFIGLAALFIWLAPIVGPLLKFVFGLIGKIFGGIIKGVSSIFSAREKSYDRKRKREVDRQRDEDREYDRSRKKVTDKQHDEDREYDRARKDAEEARRAEDHERKHRAVRDADRKKAESDDLWNAALERSARETGLKSDSDAKKGNKE